MISTDHKANYLSFTATHQPTLLVLRVGFLILFASISALVNTSSAQDTLPYVKSHSYISPENETFFSTSSGVEFRLGVGLSAIGDLDGNGVADMVASSTTADSEKGEIYVMLLNSDGSVLSHQVIKSGVTNGPTLDAGDRLGGRLSCIGDLDGDGVPDLAALASKDDDAGTDLGAIYILFLNSDGSLKGYNKFTSGVGGFTDNFNNDFTFLDISGVGDVDGDGVLDLAVGSPNCDLGGTNRGAFRYIYMNTDGSVKGFKRVSNTSTWPGGSPLANSGSFGFAVSSIGDLNGDGITDLAISARKHNNIGRVYILFMTAAQEISSFTTIEPSDLSTTFGGVPHQFSWDISAMGDLNADGVNDLLITARLADNAHTRDGQAVIVYLNEDGTVQSDEALGEGLSTEQAGTGLHDNAWLGFQCAALGDVDGDKVMDIALSAIGHDGGGGSGAKWGRVYLMNLNPKPLVVSAMITDQTDTTSGSIDLDVYGGVRPYDMAWDSKFPSRTQFDDWKLSVDSVDWAAKGLPGFTLNALTYEELQTGITPDLTDLQAGNYYLKVSDVAGTEQENVFDVGYPLEEETETGVTNIEQGTYTKSGPDGWSNMELELANHLDPEEDGWVSFVPAQEDATMAVGYRETGTSAVNGYEQMLVAIYLDGNQLKYWHNDTIRDIDETYENGDNLRLEREDTEVYIYKNDREVHVFSDASLKSKSLSIDVAIYKSQAQIRSLKASSPGANGPVLITGTITHMTCEDPNGSILGSFSVSGQSGSPTYLWTGPAGFSGSSVALMTTTIPGIYTLAITVPTTGGTKTNSKEFLLGYEVDWIEKFNTTVDQVDGYSLRNAGLLGVASGANTSASPTSSFLSRKVGFNLQSIISGSSLYYDVFGFEDMSTGDYDGAVVLFELTSVGAQFAFLSLPNATSTPWVASQDGNHLFLTQTGTTWELENRTSSGPTAIATGGAASQVPIRIKADLWAPSAILKSPLCSFPCAAPQRALLTRELSESYHRANRKLLRFGYWEDYNDDALEYSIFAMDGQAVIDQTAQPITIAHGYNELEIDLLDGGGTELDEGFYWLEVTNNKGIVRYLRFHYDNTAQ